MVAEARTWLGTPWRHQQQRKGLGADCGQMVLGVLAAVGYCRVAYEGYARIPDGRQLRALCDRQLARVDAPQPGDVVLLRLKELPVHLGILGDAGRGPDGLSLIHSYASARKCIEHDFDAGWRDAVVQFYRMRHLILVEV
ncbi:hypothetical protein [Azospirillum argentinense]|uniref:hypothetical protein n=1 Tax=Azospirillum argentinense TaxID=2970906 RepID=UPI0032DFC3D5